MRRTASPFQLAFGPSSPAGSFSPRASSAASPSGRPRPTTPTRPPRSQDFHPLSKEAQKLTRFFSANSLDTELDGAGRIMLPAFLLDHAKLGKDVVVTGSGDALEIWDRATWADYNDVLASDVDEITSSLGNTA